MANRNWASGGKVYSMHVMPVLLDCNFIVDSTNGNGLGQRSLKGPAVAQVYMASSAPAAGNPNPAAGEILVQLSDNYNRYFSGFAGFASPIGSPTTSTTAGTAAIITSLGTATPAQWLAAGFPAVYLDPQTQLPAVGAAFVPTASATIGGGATVAPTAAAGSGIDHIELVGDPNQTIAASNTSRAGAQLIFQCFSAGVKTAPAPGTVISLAFYMSNSSVMVQGE